MQFKMSEKEVVRPGRSKVERLRKLKKEKQHDVVNDRIKEWLTTSECPFTTALVILQRSMKVKSFRNYICNKVAKHLRCYTTENITASKEVKIQIFEMILKFDKNSIKLLVEAFSLDQLDLVFVKSVARKHLEKTDLTSFFIYYEMFNLNDDSFYDEIFRSNLSKKDTKLILKYAKNSKVIQIGLMESVDKLISEHYSKTNARENRDLPKFWVDFVFKSKDQYPIAYSEAKLENYETVINTAKENAKLSRSLRHIGYLLKEWKAKQISGSSLENLIFRYVGSNSNLLEKVANLVEDKFKDKKRADLLRQSLQSGSEKTPIWSDEKKIPICDHELKLTIPIENLLIVDTEAKLKECRKYFEKSKLSNGNMLPVGFDSEWVTDPCKRRNEDLGIIQFAVNDRVFLIDFVYFKDNKMRPLQEFISYIFRSRFYLILGFSLSGDKKVLSKHFSPRTLWSWRTDPIDFLKFRTSELFSETFGEETKFEPHTGKKITGLSRLCYQVKKKDI